MKLLALTGRVSRYGDGMTGHLGTPLGFGGVASAGVTSLGDGNLEEFCCRKSDIRIDSRQV